MKLFNLNKLRKDGKRVFLSDERTIEARLEMLTSIETAFAGVAAMLHEYEYPDTKEWVEAVAYGGAEALKERIIEENDHQAARLQVPQFVAKQWRRTAIEDAPRDLWAEANAHRSKIVELFRDLNAGREDITVTDEGVTVNYEQIGERIRKAFTIEVTPQILKEAEELRDIVPRICKMEDAGLRAVEVVKILCGNWLAPSKRPDLNDTLKLYDLLLDMRHQSREAVKAANPEFYYINGGE